MVYNQLQTKGLGVSEEQKQQLQKQLWNIANTLRGKMNADEFRDYILGFIFYKYLSEKLHLKANEYLKQDKQDYQDIDDKTKDGKAKLAVLKQELLESLGYFLKPNELFHMIAKRGAGISGGG